MKIRSRTTGISRYFPFQSWSGRTASGFFVVVSLLLFAWSNLAPGNVQAVRAGAADWLAPVVGAVSRPFQAVTSYAERVSGISDLQNENARLRQENERLREWYQTALQLQAENKSLQDLLHVAIEPQSRFVTARVIADSGNSFVRTLLVMAGRDNGVDKGQAVISGDGLVGRTVEVGDRAARVLLITDINSRVPVTIEGSDMRAMLAGRNDGPPVLMHLPKGSKLIAGARVITSGAGGIFPYGLPVGVVQPAEDGTTAVRMFADMDKLIHVRIVDRDEDPNLIESQP